MSFFQSPWAKKNKWLLITFLAFFFINLFLGYTLIQSYLRTINEKNLLDLLSTPSSISDPFVARKAALVAESVQEVDITGCTPHPQVFRLGDDKVQVFRNTDPKSHILTFSADKIFAIPPGDISIKIDFLRSNGVVPYFCDGGEKPVGAIYLSE